MTFLDIIEELHAHLIHKSSDFPGTPIEHVIASDLMSDVLVTDLDNAIILTSLTSEQTVRTADIVGARGILLVNDKNPQPAMKQVAEQQDITVLSTPLSMFQACVALGKLLECGNRQDTGAIAKEDHGGTN
ncbi:MAG: hypothetical protein SNJ56_02140 [Termitinemataceae bacterium]